MTDRESQIVPEPPYNTVAQLAESWQCSPKKVRRLIKKGDLIAHKFGTQIRISRADKKDYERRNRMG